MKLQDGLDFKNCLFHKALALAANDKGGVFQRLVAASYKLAPVSDPAARPAFEELARPNDFPPHDFNFITSSGVNFASFKHLWQAIDAQRQAGKR